MKKYLFIGVICCYAAFCYPQNRNVDSVMLSGINLPNSDSMERLLATNGDDTAKANLLGLLSYNYAFNQADKSVAYGHRGVQLSRQLGYRKGVAYCSQSLAWGLWGVGNYSYALQVALTVLQLYEELKDKQQIAQTHYLLANIYRDFGDYKRALIDVQIGVKMSEALKVSDIIGNAITGSIYDLQNRLDSASYYIRKAVDLDRKFNQERWGWLYYLQGNIHRKMKQYDSAMYYYRTALPLVEYKDIVETYNGIAILCKETGQIDSSIFYATEVMQKWRHISYQRGILQAANILAANYKKLNQRDSTIKYLELSKTLNDSLFNQTNERDIQNMAFNEQLRQDEILRERQQNRNRLKMYALVTVGIVFLFIALLLWRNNHHRRKAYVLLQKQKKETDTQKLRVEHTLAELKSTQSQLIQSEKMASLGELTAGIAHEIQNPLNFVNNFSEVNKELLVELKGEIKKGNLDEVNAIADDVISNEEKINHHGKRADAIVKGILQHSRSSSGVKEPTNINALADEYLRLAYHGLRAKDKSFNATMKTDYDESIGNINIIPQDMGRVILNLITNAFYTVDEKKKTAGNNYEPTVTVSTSRSPLFGRGAGGEVSISVKDNGNGIPQKILDKIFQPFFTTKPTGQGTGLGLSLSYDIVKAHGGELKVKTKEGEGATFIIQLPVV
jgi:two-component system, NtrC family, sensor kinase